MPPRKKDIGKPRDGHEIASIALKEVRLASQVLSDAAELGWTTIAPTKDFRLNALISTIASARASLRTLPEHDIEPSIDVEKTASQIVGRLIALELFSEASAMLTDSIPFVVALYSPPTGPRTRQRKRTDSHQHGSIAEKPTALMLELPRTSPVDMGPRILGIVGTFQLHAVQVLLHNANDATVEAIVDGSNILKWGPLLQQHLGREQCSALMISTFQAVAKCKSPVSPASLFRLRSWSLRCLAYYSSLKEDVFWEQVGKYSTSLIRAVGAEAKDLVTALLDDLFMVMGGREDGRRFMRGKGFVTICEFRIKLAKGSNDIAGIARIKAILERASEASPIENSPSMPVDFDLRTAQLCAGISQPASVLEHLLVDPTADFTILRTAVLAVEDCTRFVSREDLPVNLKEKVYLELERLRRGCIRLLGARFADIYPEKIEEVQRQTVEPSTPGTHRFSSEEPPTFTVAGVKLLIAVVSHLTSIAPKTILHVCRAVDSLIVLARVSASGSSGLPSRGTSDYLERALSILTAMVPPFSQEESLRYGDALRCISATHWILATSLFQKDQFAAAVPYLIRTCEIAATLVSLPKFENLALESEPGNAKLPSASLRNSTIESITAQLPKRWELLGFCQARTGDRKASYQAYCRGLLSSRHRLIHIGELASATPLSHLLAFEPVLRNMGSIAERLTVLSTFELLIPTEVSILRLFEKEFSGTAEKIIPAELPGIGALVEYQYLLLSSGGSKSQQAKTALSILLEDALRIYRADQFPIRRARILLRKLEKAFHDDDLNIVSQMIIEIQQLLLFNIHSPSKTLPAPGLADSINTTQDSSLLRCMYQHIASTYLWSALVAHRHTPPETLINDVSEPVHTALNVLRHHVLLKLSIPFKGSPRRILAEAQNTAGNARASARSGAPPKTPKRTVKRSPLDSYATVTPQKPTALQIDELQSLDRQIDMLIHVLDALGLTILKLEVLHARRALNEAHAQTRSNDGFVRISIDLAQEYAILGRMDRAGGMYAEALAALEDSDQSISNETRLRLYLRFAQATVASGNTEEALVAYAKARALAEVLAADSVPSVQRFLHRVGTLERGALASHAFSAIQASRGKFVSSLDGLLQALRLWNRAADILSQLNQPPPPNQKVPSTSIPNPFEVSESSDDGIVAHQKPVFDGLQWRITGGILTTLFALARVYFMRGSAKESQFFLEQARTLADSVRAKGLLCRALLRLAELQIYSGCLKDADQLLSTAAPILLQISGPDSADMYRIRGNFSLRLEQVDLARQLFGTASSILGSLEQFFSEVESKALRGSAGGTGIQVEQHEDLVPSLAASILRQRIWLLRDTAGNDSEYGRLLDQFLALPPSSQTKTEEHGLMGKLSLEEVYARFRADIVLSSLPDSTVAVPMGMSGGEIVTPPTATRDLLSALSTAENFFWSCLELNVDLGEVPQVRDAAISLALIRAYQTALGAKTKNVSTVTAAVLDLAAAPTLRRELLDCIDRKTVHKAGDDLEWRIMSATGSPLRSSHSKPHRGALLFTGHDSDDESGEDDHTSMTDYWQELRERYRSEGSDPVSLATSQTDFLPFNWTVISVTVTEDRSTMIISRQRPQQKPLIFYLPMNRQERREDNTENDFTYDVAMEELQSIIDASNATSRNAIDVSGHAERKAWWAERISLDKRLRTLVENVEFCWLGVFKTAFSEPPMLSPNLLSAFRTKLETVLRRNGCMHDKKFKNHLHLDDVVLECFSTLSPKCRDEELEDLAYFVLDLFQLHGAQVAVSEIDMDQLVVDLRTVLEEHVSATKKMNVTSQSDHHMFLVLDKNVQAIPWESIPVLRGRSVSRIPSISFLVDRLHLVRYLGGLPTSGSMESREVINRARVDPRKTFFILNPSGDLKPTQDRFEDWLKGMRKVGWNGIVGRVPTEDEMIRALMDNDLVIYFGHGGAEQYLRSYKIRNLPRCASTMLWGCSSGALRHMGDFDPVGTPYHYMVAGCPSLIANLWDVTDKDIDKFSESVFQNLRLDEQHVRNWKPSSVLAPDTQNAKPKKRVPDSNSVPTPEGMSIVAAVARSRDSCKLPYLTGAAPVAYGIPYYL